MVVVPVEELHMQVHAGILGKALEEVFEHGRFDTAGHRRRKVHVPHEPDAVAGVAQ